MTTLFDDKSDEVIDLSIGAPSRDLMPISMLAAACQTALSSNEEAWRSLQYGPETGDYRFREELATLLSEQVSSLCPNARVHSHHLACTSGASQSFVNLLNLFTDPTHTAYVFVQSPTYHLIFQMVKDRGFQQSQLVAVPEDADGIDIEWVVMKLEELQIGKTPLDPRYYNVALYTVPTYGNPSGTILSHQRRQKLVEIARRHHMLVICDDVYDMLYQDPGCMPPPSLVSYDLEDEADHQGQGNIVSNGTFSKILSPGMRCGWVQARAGIIQRIAESGLYASGGSPAHFVSKLILEAMRDQSLAKHIQHTRQELQDRLENGLIESINKLLVPLGCTFHKPHGGYFVWLKLPSATNSAKLQQTIEQNEIKVSCGYGYKFAVPTAGDVENKQDIGSHIRLCFAFYNTLDLQTAVSRLHQAIKQCI